MCLVVDSWIQHSLPKRHLEGYGSPCIAEVKKRTKTEFKNEVEF